jgi:hypothetical protein
MQHIELRRAATALAAPGPWQNHWARIQAARAAKDASASWVLGEPSIILEHIAALHTEHVSVPVSSYHLASAYMTACKFFLVDRNAVLLEGQAGPRTRHSQLPPSRLPQVTYHRTMPNWMLADQALRLGLLAWYRLPTNLELWLQGPQASLPGARCCLHPAPPPRRLHLVSWDCEALEGSVLFYLVRTWALLSGCAEARCWGTCCEIPRAVVCGQAGSAAFPSPYHGSCNANRALWTGHVTSKACKRSCTVQATCLACSQPLSVHLVAANHLGNTNLHSLRHHFFESIAFTLCQIALLIMGRAHQACTSLRLSRRAVAASCSSHAAKPSCSSFGRAASTASTL